MKEYFKLAADIFLLLIGIGVVVAVVFGWAWLAHWLWVNVHPVAGGVAGLAGLSLGLAAMAMDDGEGWA